MALLKIKPYSEIDKPLGFEMVLAEISTLFINLPTDRIDSEIEAAQRRVCELLDLDRSTLFQILEEEPGLLLTHIHQPPGTLPPPEKLNANDFFPWSVKKVLGGETVAISKMTDLPPEAGRDRESFDFYGTRSVVADILSFTRTKGAYAGVSLEGSVISTKDKWNAAYYGKAVSPVDIIVKRSVGNPGSKALRTSVSKAAAKK